MPDLPGIDAALEREFVVWKQKVREAAEAFGRAQQWVQTTPLSDADRAELKQIYRKLVKALHPDVHPDQGEPARDLWQRVQAAHAASALADLKALEVLAGDVVLPLPEPHPDAPGGVRAERDKIAGMITALDRKRAEAEALPPFTLREQLADDAWIAARRAEIETDIAPLEAQRSALESYLQQLLTIPFHAAGPGPN